MLRSIFLLCVPAVLLVAADNPNYSGHWVADLTKSDFGMAPPPERLERDIDHKDPDMKVKTTQKGQRGESVTESKYTTDGKESTIQMRGREAKIKAVFKDGKLVVASKSEINGAEIGQTETWTLSGDGKTLTIENEVKAPQGEFKMKLLLTKGS